MIVTGRLTPASKPTPAPCCYAGTDAGPCGGPTTNVGDGHDYCMNHGDLRMGGSR